MGVSVQLFAIDTKQSSRDMTEDSARKYASGKPALPNLLLIVSAIRAMPITNQIRRRISIFNPFFCVIILVWVDWIARILRWQEDNNSSFRRISGDVESHVPEWRSAALKSFQLRTALENQ